MNYALVTGGSRGIGRAVCLQLAQMGYNIIINYASDKESALITKKMVEETGVKADLLPFNVSSGTEVESALDQWREEHKEDFIAVLVNNAGIRKDNMLILMQDEEWHNVFNITVNGFFYVTRNVLKNMIRKRSGRIINIVSVSGLTGLPGQSNYSASRSALIGATKALAKEVGTRNITVNAVAPGYIETDMTQDLDQDAIKSQIPVGRFGTAEEVAHAVGFLVSGQAGYITGNVLSINGGLYT